MGMWKHWSGRAYHFKPRPGKEEKKSSWWLDFDVALAGRMKEEEEGEIKILFPLRLFAFWKGRGKEGKKKKIWWQKWEEEEEKKKRRRKRGRYARRRRGCVEEKEELCVSQRKRMIKNQNIFLWLLAKTEEGETRARVKGDNNQCSCFERENIFTFKYVRIAHLIWITVWWDKKWTKVPLLLFSERRWHLLQNTAEALCLCPIF